MSLKKQLARYKKHLSHSTETAIDQSPEKKATEMVQEGILDQPLKQAAKDLNAQVKVFEGQAMLVKESRYPLEMQHGHYRFEELHEAVALWQTDLKEHPLSSYNLVAEDLLFFDTETTGLGAGAGHMIFLLGTGKVTGEEFIVTQYFLPGPGHEAAFYYYFLSDCKDLSNLVTFNGKAFDWPRVKTRVQFVRDRVPKLPEFGHFDLLHASRRFWKTQLDSVRLSNVEEAILGLERDMDVPGHMAPFLYFQFLKAPKASLVKGVLEHNEEDIKSLVTLYIHLTRLLHQKTSLSLKEEYECCGWLTSLGWTKEAVIRLEKCLSTSRVEAPLKSKMIQLLAFNYKKLQDFDRANTYFLQLIKENLEHNHDIFIEVAKYYEHRVSDFEKAIFYSEKARESYLLNPENNRSELEDIDHRLMRLYTKISPV